MKNQAKTAGPVVFYTERAVFQAANPALLKEDFSGTSVPIGGILSCPPPLDDSTDDACFMPGAAVPGFSLDVIPADDVGDYVVVHHALDLDCVAVGPNRFVDETTWQFAFTEAVGFDLYTPLHAEPTNYEIKVFGLTGLLGSTTITTGGTAAAFFGVSAPGAGGIDRIEVRETFDGTGELYCDLEFGLVPYLVELLDFRLE